MVTTELDSFVQKFKQLWKSGLGAHLDIDTHGGQAWVGLRVRLSHAPGPVHHAHHHLPSQPRRTRNGPAQQRRRARRAAVRQEEAEEAIVDEPAVEDAAKADLPVAVEAAKQQLDSVTEEAAVDIVGDSNNHSKKLVLTLEKSEGRTDETGNPSPIPQIDGAAAEQVAVYEFKSDYGEEDIEYSLLEIFQDSATLVSRVALRPRSAEHLCTVEIKLGDSENFSWPNMRKDQKEVFSDLQKIVK